MPQLSPLNWILLYMLFWSAIICMSVMIWWFNSNHFETQCSTNMTKENKWNW